MSDTLKEYCLEQNGEKVRSLLRIKLYGDPILLRYQEEMKLFGDWLFEPHSDIHDELPASEWNEDYWQLVIFDLQDNFSKHRFQHLLDVAKIVKASEIECIRKEIEKQEQEERERKEREVREQETWQQTEQEAPPVSEMDQNPIQPPPVKTTYRESEEAKRKRLREERYRLRMSLLIIGIIVAVIILIIVLRG